MNRLKLIILTGLILSSCSSSGDRTAFREVRYVFNSVSPAISSLLESDPGVRETSVNDLFRKAYEEGGPLIERDSLFPDYVRATFIYRDTTHQQEIGFEVAGIYEEHRLGDRKLYPIDSTGLYYRSYLFPDDLCLAYRFVLTDKETGTTKKICDPLNDNRAPTGEMKSFSWSVLDLRPDEPDWFTRRHGDTGSRLDALTVTSNILENTRNIYVYLPPGYDGTSGKYPVIYLFDSFIYLHRIEVPNVMDNLIREKKIEPMIAVFIDNPTGTSRLSELPMNPLFRDFMVTELVPEIRQVYRVTDDPRETIVGGISYGGLAAAYVAFECDSVFGKVLSQSGGFWRDLELKDAGGAEYRGDRLINRFLQEKKRDIRLFLDWGLQEDMVFGANRRFVRVLDQLDYDFKFVEFNGWHCWSNSRKTFPDGLMYLTKNQ